MPMLNHIAERTSGRLHPEVTCHLYGQDKDGLTCRIAGVVVAHIYAYFGILTHALPAWRPATVERFPSGCMNSDRRIFTRSTPYDRKGSSRTKCQVMHHPRPRISVRDGHQLAHRRARNSLVVADFPMAVAQVRRPWLVPYSVRYSQCYLHPLGSSHSTLTGHSGATSPLTVVARGLPSKLLGGLALCALWHCKR